MILDELSQSTGEWLRGTGPQADVVVSSRIRLARNLADFPFTNRASAMQKGEIEALLRESIESLLSVQRGHHLIALLEKWVRKQGLHRLLVVDEQNASGACVCRAGHGRESPKGSLPSRP